MDMREAEEKKKHRWLRKCSFSLQKILDFWLEKGVDGVLIDDMHALFEAELVTLDEPVNELEENIQVVRRQTRQQFFKGHF